MKRLRPVHVGTVTYQVVVATEKERPALADADGECAFEEQRIYLNAKCSEERRQATLLHEVIHAAMFESGARQVLKLDHDDDEQIVLMLTAALHQAVKVQA